MLHAPLLPKAGAQLSQESWQLTAPSRYCGAPTQSPSLEKAGNDDYFSNPKMIFGFLIIRFPWFSHTAADLPFSISDTFSKDTDCGDILQLDSVPPPRVAPFLLPFGATCTKQQQFSARRFGKAEALPAASGAMELPPGSLWEASSRAGKLQLCSSPLSRPCCARLAGCLQRGRAKQGYFKC